MPRLPHYANLCYLQRLPYTSPRPKRNRPKSDATTAFNVSRISVITLRTNSGKLVPMMSVHSIMFQDNIVIEKFSCFFLHPSNKWVFATRFVIFYHRVNCEIDIFFLAMITFDLFIFYSILLFLLKRSICMPRNVICRIFFMKLSIWPLIHLRFVFRANSINQLY